MRHPDVALPETRRPSRATLAAVAGPTLLLAASEAALFLDRLDVALGGHLLTLLACALGPVWLRDETAVLRAFVLLPAFRLVNLGMPVFVDLTLGWFPLVYGPLLPAAGYVAWRRDDVPLVAGWRTALLALPAVLAASAALGVVEFLIIAPEGLVTGASIPQFVALTVVMVLFVGLLEELLYRGVLQRTLRERVGRAPAVLVASLLFGLMHSAYGTGLEIAFAALLGLGYAVVYERTDNMPLIVLLHGTLNVFLFGVYPVFGLPV